MSGLIGEIVDGVTALVTGGMQIDDETRRAAKQSVRDTLARASERDRRELLSTRADAVDAHHIARVRAMAVAGTPIDNGAGQWQLTIPFAGAPRWFRIELP